ncbi:SURF1 family protein [Allopusillimonas ginsengisoli]|uniref:SURF1 family protein n=1 Tax=Allopusillimonas ginsengisoli TaxID=453575 RepID=UPI0010C236C2|nr:SURF1 family protein [Allopusillimonas ginsengisoli]
MARPSFSYRTLAALILLAVLAVVCTSLGKWQLSRAAERDAIRASIDHGRSRAPLQLTADTPAQALAPWRAATAEGAWRPDLTVLLENRNYQGQPGYWVATPLLLQQPANTAVLVLRGWLPREALAVAGGSQQGQDASGLPPGASSSGTVRGALKTLTLPEGARLVQGELLQHVPRLFDLGEWGAGKHATHLPSALPLEDGSLPAVQNLEIKDYAAATGLTFIPIVLAQTAADRASGATVQANAARPSQDDPASQLHDTHAQHADTTADAVGAQATGPAANQAANSSLVYDWPTPSLDSDKNRGYALQWFGFATIAVIAWLVVAARALRRKKNS